MTLAPVHPETLALHGGRYRADPATGAVAPPLYQTTSFQFRDTEHARRLFALEEIGYTYTRTVNPTREVLEQRLAALEGGAAALALASGQAASLYAVLALAGASDNIVAARDLRDSPQGSFTHRLAALGIETRFVDPGDPGNFARAADDRTRAFLGATLSVPALTVLPIAAIAETGRGLGVPLIVDNSAAPLSTRPLDLGAAIVVYSATEYLGGHGTTVGGVIIDGGTFPWEAHAARFPTLTSPDPSYHGTVWVDLVRPWGPVAFVARTRAGMLRDFGATISPFAAFQLIQGVETLPLRIRRHRDNAVKVAAFLRDQPQVASVIYPDHGALVAFTPSGGAEEVRRIVASLRLFHHVAEFGDARSGVIHTSNPDRILLSVGLEHPDDILADLARALD